ncbi:hypothetical protein ON010_g3937 [Phytophthora cinnamomi]|nr:hypothetical protein ON010_g3937 [Phytophthora cinnamomi]
MESFSTGTEDEESASASQEAQDHPSNGVGDGEWNPEYPTGPPSSSSGKDLLQKELSGYDESTGTQLNPEATAYQSPFGETAPAEEQQAGAYTYTSAETTTYGESTGTQLNPEAAAYESPFAEKTPVEGRQADTYNAYAGAATDTGAFNAYTSSETTTYGEAAGSQTNPEAVTSGSPFEKTPEYGQQTGAYSAYTGAGTTTYSQSNPEAAAYKSAIAEEAPGGEQQVGVDYANNGENADVQSNPEAAAYQSTFEKAPEEAQQEGTHNTYTGAATETGVYTNAQSTTYGENTGAQTNPETTAYKSPFTEELPEEQQAGTTTYPTPDTEKTPKNEQQAGALSSYTNAETTAYSESTNTQSSPEVVAEKKASEGSGDTAAFKSYSGAGTYTGGSPGESSAKNAEQPGGAYSNYNQDYYKNTAASAKATTGAEITSAGTPYSESNPSENEALAAGANNQGYYSGYKSAANNANAYNQNYYTSYKGATNNANTYNQAYYSGRTGATNNAGTYNTYTGAGRLRTAGGNRRLEPTTLTMATVATWVLPRMWAPTSRTQVLGRPRTVNRRARGSYVLSRALSTSNALARNICAIFTGAGGKEGSLVC